MNTPLSSKLAKVIQANMPVPKDEYSQEELGEKLQRMGYDLEELERDNPYNQWMYQDE